MRKKIISAFLISCLFVTTLLVGCASKDDSKKAEGKELTVSIAASLKKPMEDIAKKFNEETGIKITYNTGGSGTLKKQISEGANVDLFFSANTKYMDELINEKLVNKDDTYNFLTNSLVLIENNDMKKDIKSLNDLKDTKGKIAIGDLKTVPAGQYAKQTLDNLKLWDSLKDRFVYAKSVSNVVSYVENGDVDYGFVYKTDAKDIKGINIAYEIPNKYHKEIQYSLCVLKDSKNAEESKKFVEFLKGDESKKVFKEYGFGVE
ncbi:molybdate ABC transporter substrate-binding protein [Clostridium sp.]|uniref:molybdate ABC transporter substrate-binding protein n=1 Tax=Clostridium sp. TaxID=1506 RepID=UPI0026DD5A92|nr:molybdate ABC transporter substrate-binding protein [Clostridium sp.]MDO5038852.1 molybdate ABC transporter substrate-binding protein [Clostridium sp.]